MGQHQALPIVQPLLSTTSVGLLEHFSSQLSSQTCQPRSSRLSCEDKGSRCISFHLFTELPPCFAGHHLKDAEEKCLEANLTLVRFGKGVKSKCWAGAGWDTAWVYEQGYQDKTQRNATTEMVCLLFPMQKEGKELLQPTAWILQPATLCKKHPGMSDQLICCSAPFQKQELAHLCITLHQFSSKTTKCFYGRKSPLDFPQISEA